MECRDIAIVGLSCRFPGAPSPQAFWQLLQRGDCAVGEVPPERWDPDAYFDPDPSVPGKTISRWGGFLDAIEDFDHAFFRISKPEARQLDPQQRLLLELSWEALEDAGIAADRLAGGDVGVFVGIMGSDYARLAEAHTSGIDRYTGTGTSGAVAANRISYQLDLRGPSVRVDTACSSSLVAVHLASQSLRLGECEAALVGGVNAILLPHGAIYFSQAGLMSAKGRCRSFDAEADGFVRGEGGGVVVLKRLDEARAARDRIYAVLRGSAVNQDGRSNGLTAPSREAQETVIRRAYAAAGIHPRCADYVEAHGSATPLGDRIEALALGATVGSERPEASPCRIGSVKTNLGHLEAAAGIAGLVKVALALQHRELPASLAFERPNPDIPFAELGLRVQSATERWSRRARPLVASVSSFGFGGTNAHVVLEEPPDPSPDSAAPPVGLLPISARTPASLRRQIESYAELLARPDVDDAAARRIGWAAATRRGQLEHRAAVVGSTRAELLEGLAARLERADARPARRRPSIVFLFPGQGSQWLGMGRDLLEVSPVFASALRECEEALRPGLRHTLPNGLNDLTDLDLSSTASVQPALFAIQVALARLWQSFGVEPSAVVGHSMGEVAAAHVAGALSLSDAAGVICVRSRLAARASGKGAMLGVGLSSAEALRRLDDLRSRIDVAASNSRSHCVLAGEKQDLAVATRRLDALGVSTRWLDVQFASHSRQMDPLLGELGAELEGLSPSAARIPFFSTVTGRRESGPSLDASYWQRNLRGTVRFAAVLDELLNVGAQLFIELSPQPTLRAPVTEESARRGAEALFLPSLHRDAEGWPSILRSLATVFEEGQPVGWSDVHGRPSPHRDLPRHGWNRVRCWLTDRPESVAPAEAIARRAPAGSRAANRASCEPELETYEQTWEPVANPVGPTREDERVLLLGPDLARSGAIAAPLRAQGVECAVEVGPDLVPNTDPERALAALRERAEGARALHIVWMPDLAQGDPLDRSIAACSTAVALARALPSLPASRTRLSVATRASGGAAGRPAALEQCALAGLLRSLAAEHPELGLRRIELGSDPDPASLRLAAAILAADSPEEEWALHGGRAFVPRLRARHLEAADRRPRSSGAGTVLICGGGRGMGLASAAWWAGRGARSIVLLARSAMDAGCRERIRRLRAEGVEATYVRADVCDREAMARVFDELDAVGRPVRAVVHSAAVIANRTLQRESPDSLREVLAPKVAGSWLLHELCEGREVDDFVLYSSAVGTLGAAGQGAYAAGNTFQDGLARLRQAGGKRALSLAWGPCSDAGFSVRGGHLDGLAAVGMHALATSEGLDAAQRRGEDAPAHLLLLRADWPRWQASRTRPDPRVPAGATSSVPPVEEPRSNDPLPAPLTPGGEASSLEAYVRDLLARILGIPERSLHAGTRLIDLGVDSLCKLEIHRQARADTRCPLSLEAIFDVETVEDLVHELAAGFETDAPSPAAG